MFTIPPLQQPKPRKSISGMDDNAIFTFPAKRRPFGKNYQKYFLACVFLLVFVSTTKMVFFPPAVVGPSGCKCLNTVHAAAERDDVDTNSHGTSDKKQNGSVESYNSHSILTTFKMLDQKMFKLVVFDGENFSVYAHDMHAEKPLRDNFGFPLLLESLLTNFPERFKKGQRPFELLMVESDTISTTCASTFCPEAKRWAPVVLHGTGLRNESMLPTVKVFPAGGHFKQCMYNNRMKLGPCQPWGKQQDNVHDWSTLKRQIVWRGSDFGHFIPHMKEGLKNDWLENFFSQPNTTKMSTARIIDHVVEHCALITPRWCLVAKSLQQSNQTNELSERWLDARFVAHKNPRKVYPLHKALGSFGVNAVINDYMGPDEAEQYAYHIDVAGGGGTTWTGTLTKLLFSGVLFHHETPMKDWFYDEMKPYIHYIPVSTHLENLTRAFEWAESHQVEVQKIAKEATKLARYLQGEEYLNGLYDKLYVQYLGSVVHAYESFGVWNATFQQYRSEGFKLRRVVDCASTAHEKYCKLSVLSKGGKSA